jgi:O-acetyl-ADP-ribose deacetylase (regulator of RNase III)
MTEEEKLEEVNALLVEDLPEYREEASFFPKEEEAQLRLFRTLRNVRPPLPLSQRYLELEGEILEEEKKKKGIIDVLSLPKTKNPRIALFQGDITVLKADAIVNAANAELLGCFVPLHSCIDNAIHSAAGAGLREECDEIMRKQGHPEETGKAKITRGYHLPAAHVIHTVGPIVSGEVTEENRKDLASCYRSCLSLAAEHSLSSLVFCCLSTGVFSFPNGEAAKIAVSTVTEYLSSHPLPQLVVFDVFGEKDRQIYQRLLS